MGLTAKQQRFVIEYPVDSNGTQAAIRAGYSELTAAPIGSRLLKDPEIRAAIRAHEADLAAAAGITVQKILRYWDEIAGADPRELIRIEMRCCRHCYGIGHEYEWNEWEFRKACEAAAAHRCGKNCEDPCRKSTPPFPAGGLGFIAQRAPAADCPNCKGEGEPFTKLGDMRTVSPAAARLIAGVKQTKDGIEIKFMDRAEATRNLAQFRGMLINRGEIAGPGGGPIPIASATVNLNELTDEQLVIIAAGGGNNGGSSELPAAMVLEGNQLTAGSNP